MRRRLLALDVAARRGDTRDLEVGVRLAVLEPDPEREPEAELEAELDALAFDVGVERTLDERRVLIDPPKGLLDLIQPKRPSR